MYIPLLIDGLLYTYLHNSLVGVVASVLDVLDVEVPPVVAAEETTLDVVTE